MSYIEKYVLVFENQKQRLDEKVKRCRENGLPENPINLYTMTSSNFETITVGEYALNNDINTMKNCYYNAALAQEKAMIYFDANSNLKSSGFISMLSYRELFFAIISDSNDLIIRYAMLMGGRGDLDMKDTDIFTYNWGYALKYTVLDDDVLALEHVSQLKDAKRSHFTHCLKAIIEKDEQQVNLSLNEILKKQKESRNFKNSSQELFSTITVALAKLATRKGILVNIDDPIAPREVIEKSEVKYEVHEIIKLFV